MKKLMINQKESKQVRIAQTTVKRHENKNKKQKAMGNITPTMDHYPRNGYMGDTDP